MTATAFDRSSQDVGNILGLEHVNLEIPDRDLADRFYVSAMGFTRDPYADRGLIGTTWVNLGGQQLHLPFGPAGQRLRGEIGLVVPDPEGVARRIDRLLERFEPLAATDAGWGYDDGAVVVRCPWGNRYRLHGPEAFEGMALGMPYVELQTEVGTAEGIAAFYRRVLGAPTTVEDHPRGRRAAVAIGRRQHLYFVERQEPLAPYDGHHLAIYLHRFSDAYHWLRERELITRETDDHEYRFTDIVDPESGRLCSVMEHEVRSMFHPMFGRPLVNRDLGQDLGIDYRPGHDAVVGLHNCGVG